MLSYEEFIQEMQRQTAERFGKEYDVRIRKLRKTNIGLTETLNIFQKPDTEGRISPHFFLHPMYEKYRKGTDVAGLVVEILCAYDEQKESTVEIAEKVKELDDYERCRKKIYFRLINTENNRILLEDVPHFEILDLSMIFYILVSEGTEGGSSALIHNELLNLWKKSAEEVKEEAEENTPELFPARIQTMKSVMEGFFPAAGKEEKPPEEKKCRREEPDMNEIFVVSNQKMTNGFSAVFYPGELKAVAEKVEKDVYIIPSSTHEGLLIPADSCVSGNELCKMVQAVNKDYVSDEEVLSDHVYFYCRKTDSIRLVKGDESVCASF